MGGVVTKTLKLFIETIIKNHFDNSAKQFSDFTKSLRIFIPADFGRQLMFHTPDKFSKYKAEEIRKFALKVFMPVFEKFLGEKHESVFWKLRDFVLKMENDNTIPDILEKDSKILIKSMEDTLGKKFITLKAHELKHAHLFKQEFASMKSFCCFPMENQLSFPKKMLHSTTTVDNEFMFAGNLQFFNPKLQQLLNIDVSEIFSNKKKSAFAFEVKKQLFTVTKFEKDIIDATQKSPFCISFS